MNHLVEKTLLAIEERCSATNKPAILSSFGKDSMVVLSLCRRLRLTLPVIYHRNPWFPAKNAFADQVIVQWDLEVYDWPPAICGVKTKADRIEPVFGYQYGSRSMIKVPLNILSPKEDERFLCGRIHMLERPRGTFAAPWDLLIWGQKSSDVDQFEGHCKLLTDFVAGDKEIGAPDMFYPLRDWSGDDVWDYIVENNVPFQKNRYNVLTRREHADKTFNNDYAPACMKCLDRREPEMVFCPKLNKQIPNISAQVPDLEQKFDYIEYHEPVGEVVK